MGLVHDLTQAAVIMTLGMVVTFSFLVVLILAIQVSSRIIAKFAPEAKPQKQDPASPAQEKIDGSVIAAITIAVKKYRDDKKIKIRGF